MESELSDETALRSQFTVDDLDIEILPLIYEIIRRFVYFNNLTMILQGYFYYDIKLFQNENITFACFVISILFLVFCILDYKCIIFYIPVYKFNFEIICKYLFITSF